MSTVLFLGPVSPTMAEDMFVGVIRFRVWRWDHPWVESRPNVIPKSEKGAWGQKQTQLWLGG